MPREKAHDLKGKERTDDVIIGDEISFKDLLLSKWTLMGLESAGFVKPSPIQRKAIPLGRCGFDLIVQAKSGTGKTCVFAVVALEMINSDLDQLQVLILSPTREISVQIQQVVSTIGKGLKKLRVKSFIGGLPLTTDKQNLQRCQIAVGAPGRIKHLISEGSMKLDAVRLFILDEADKLMEKSFRADVSFIYLKLPQTKQVIATSATFSPELEAFVSLYMMSPMRINLGEGIFLKGIRQFITVVTCHMNPLNQMNNKFDELLRILSNVSFKQCMIFSNYQSRVESICTLLKSKDWPAIYISGCQSQATRLEVMSRLKEFQCRILVSTDLSSRGIDAENVNLVVNFDLPHDGATYMHRIGRAGRYGSRGIAVTILQSGDELKEFQRMHHALGGREFQISVLPGGKFNFDIWHEKDENFEKIWNLETCQLGYRKEEEEGKGNEKCSGELDERKENGRNAEDEEEINDEIEGKKEIGCEPEGNKGNCNGGDEEENLNFLKEKINSYLRSAYKDEQKCLQLSEFVNQSKEKTFSIRDFPQEIISCLISVEQKAWKEFKKEFESSCDSPISRTEAKLNRIEIEKDSEIFKGCEIIEKSVYKNKCKKNMENGEKEEEVDFYRSEVNESERDNCGRLGKEEENESDSNCDEESQEESESYSDSNEESRGNCYKEDYSQKIHEGCQRKNSSKVNSILLKNWYATWYDQISVVQQYVNYVKYFQLQEGNI